jgi:hypothetical protein
MRCVHDAHARPKPNHRRTAFFITAYCAQLAKITISAKVYAIKLNPNKGMVTFLPAQNRQKSAFRTVSPRAWYAKGKQKPAAIRAMTTCDNSLPTHDIFPQPLPFLALSTESKK